jgi:exodeoxyribonuclease V beta subunit
MMADSLTMQKLNPASIPLSGRHLIEASAGTGKTYNITHLYLRLLIEKQLTVQQILVMTFTRAATEELRGRIEQTVRRALNDWEHLRQTDDFFSALQLDPEQEQKASACLQAALLELDDAAIFTIHGFCGRALSTQAFSSGVPMDITMEADTSELLLDSVRDWMRKVNQKETDFELLKAKSWHQPEEFLNQFYRALTSNISVQAAETESLQQFYEQTIDDWMAEQFNEQKKQVYAELIREEEEVLNTLVYGHKQEQKRQQEWQSLLGWLLQTHAEHCPKALGDFINGNRYRGDEFLKMTFAPLKQLKDDYKNVFTKRQKELQSHQDSVPVNQLVIQGIKFIRQRFMALKQKQAVMDFNDLIWLLSERLSSNKEGPLVTQLRTQYPVALVDEFQDTDPQQYTIFDTLYPKTDPYNALFMIGDPKQAIYGFRGGDIFTYLAARSEADCHWYMDTNWRSIEPIVTGYNRLFWGQPLDVEQPVDVFRYGIDYEKIHFSSQAKAAEIDFDDPDKTRAAVNYAWLDSITHPAGAKGEPITDDWRRGLGGWCVLEITRLLNQARLGKEPLQEQDIAILVRSGTEAQLMIQYLAEAGYSCVYMSERENIFNSEQAWELLRVLRGILECENDALLTAALSSALMGGNAQLLAECHSSDNDTAWEQQREQAIQFRNIWLQKGCMSLLLLLIREQFKPHPASHERALTNMIHLAELLQKASRQYKHPQQLLKWFTDQCHNSSVNEEAELRLESDENLIRIITQHGSKGLEYPVVFIPFSSGYRDPARFGNRPVDYYEYHDPVNGQLLGQVGQSHEAIRLTQEEGHAESVRLLYVAITRATHRCYLGVAPFDKSHLSPLGLTLKLDDVSQWELTLRHLINSANNSSALVAIETDDINLSQACLAQTLTGRKIQKQHELENSVNNTLAAEKLTRAVASDWTLSSFSSLTRENYAARQDKKERMDDDTWLEHNADEAMTLPLRFSLKKGAAAGNLLHDILEHKNFESSGDWPLTNPVRRFGELGDDQQNELVEWLQECLDTPLPSLFPEEQGPKLSKLGWYQTLRETEFYFTMDNLDLNKLRRCLQAHRQQAVPPFFPGQEQIKGMMHGFIDLIFEYNDRYYVADYKSTHLGDRFDNYHLQALRENNQHHYYDLQYLIYSLALHRYLSVRIRDYQADTHFGGVYYLYLRGMSPANELTYGVYYTRIDTKLLKQLDKAFKTGLI